MKVTYNLEKPNIFHKTISSQQFIHSAQYRQGVNDALDEMLRYNQHLINSAYKDGLIRLQDNMVDAIYSIAEENKIHIDWNDEWILIRTIVFNVYLYALKRMDYLKTIKNELNQMLINRNTRNGINLKIRYAVIKRDCFKCRLCGLSPSYDPKVVLEVDHIVPLTKGGDDAMDNYQTLCQFCNSGKSNDF